MYTRKIYHLHRVLRIVGGEVDIGIAQKKPVAPIFFLSVWVRFFLRGWGAPGGGLKVASKLKKIAKAHT